MFLSSIMPEIHVLRYSTRLFRDARINTHTALVARALGASKIIFTEEFRETKKTIEQVNADFGTGFEVEFETNWKKTLKEHLANGFTLVHLTAFGLPIQSKIGEIRKNEKLLVIIGSEKVPKEFFEQSPYNIAVGNQPHSEVAALAIFLHEFFQGKELDVKMSGTKEIIPQEKGRKVERKEKMN